jgi:hypothetical protein
MSAIPVTTTALTGSRLPWRQIRWGLTGLYLFVTLLITNLTEGGSWRNGSFDAAVGRIRNYHRPLDFLGTVRTEREIIVGWMVGLFLVQLVGRTWRDLLRTILSWAPFTLALYLYDFARSVGYRIHGGGDAEPMSITPQITVDKWFGGGRLPTTILQEHFYDPKHIYAYDVIVSAVYTSHFLVPYLFAGLLWVRWQRLWRWYAGMFVAINFTACDFRFGDYRAPLVRRAK